MTSNLFDLSGRVALVIGASRGIGRAIAKGLAEAGANIAMCSRTEADLHRAAAFVEPAALPWLLLDVVGAQDGPTGGHRLTSTAFIHGLNTVGGIAPSTGCALETDVGKKASVPYTADYLFYKREPAVSNSHEAWLSCPVRT